MPLRRDVVGEQLFKAIGAEIDSRDPQVARGCVPVAAPLSRRVPLAALSLRAAALPVTTPRLLNRLSGAWVSVALFRRCTMALFGKVFGEESRAPAASSASGAVPQPRLLAQELCLAAALMPLIAADVTTPFCKKVFATDASLGLGAFCSTEVSPQLAQSIWLNGDRRGAYSRLSTGAASLLEALGVETAAEESRDETCFAVPSAGLPFRLDLVEVGLPAPFVSAEAAALGLQVGPPFHPRHSPFFNLANPDLLVWFYSVLKAGYIKALVLHSPVVPGSASLAVHGSPLCNGFVPGNFAAPTPMPSTCPTLSLSACCRLALWPPYSVARKRLQRCRPPLFPRRPLLLAASPLLPVPLEEKPVVTGRLLRFG